MCTRCKGDAARKSRRDYQMMFQDPYASLDPRMRVGSIIREPLRVQHVGASSEQIRRVAQLLEEVGLSARATERYPARVLGRPAPAHRPRPGPRPRTQARGGRRAGLGARRLDPGADPQPHERPPGPPRDDLHDDLPRSSVIRYMADTIGVMYLGKLVELGPASAVYRTPAHHYTRALLDAVPVAEVLAGVRTQAGRPGRPALGGQPAVGLPVPDALPASPGDLRERGARALGVLRRPRRRLPLPAGNAGTGRALAPRGDDVAGRPRPVRTAAGGRRRSRAAHRR